MYSFNLYRGSLGTWSRKSEKCHRKSENRVRGRNLDVGRRTAEPSQKYAWSRIKWRKTESGMMEHAGHAACTQENERCLQKFAQKVPRQKITKETQAQLKQYLGIGLRTEENRGTSSVRADNRCLAATTGPLQSPLLLNCFTDFGEFSMGSRTFQVATLSRFVARATFDSTFWRRIFFFNFSTPCI